MSTPDIPAKCACVWVRQYIFLHSLQKMSDTRVRVSCRAFFEIFLPGVSKMSASSARDARVTFLGCSVSLSIHRLIILHFIMGQPVSLPADALAYRAVPGGVAFVAADGSFTYNGVLVMQAFASFAARLQLPNARVIGARISRSGICAAIFVREVAANAPPAADSDSETDDDDNDDIHAIVTVGNTREARGFTTLYNTGIRREQHVSMLGPDILLDDGTLVLLYPGSMSVDIHCCDRSRPEGHQQYLYEHDILSMQERGADEEGDNYYRCGWLAAIGNRHHIILLTAFEGNGRVSGQPTTWPLPADRFGEEMIFRVDFLHREQDGTSLRYLTPLQQPYGTTANPVDTLYLELEFGCGTDIMTAASCQKDGEEGWVRAFQDSRVVFEKSPVLPSGVSDHFAKCVSVPGGYVSMRYSGFVEVFASDGERIASLSRRENPTQGLSCSSNGILVGGTLLFRTTVEALLSARAAVKTAALCSNRLQQQSPLSASFLIPAELWMMIHVFCLTLKY